MPDRLGTHPTPRARPVADLPGDALSARPDELARHWAIALILARPLEDVGDIPLEDLVREAPSLCAQALRALHSDVELDRLTGRGASSARGDCAPARRLAAICGARDPAGVVQAVEALRGVLWEMLLDRLHDPPARQIADLSDRLAYVCAAALAVAVQGAPAPAAHAPVGDADAASGVPEPSVRDFANRPAPGPAPGPAPSPAPARRAIIVDERARVPASPAGTGGEIEIRDERGEHGPGAWIGSIGGQLRRFERDGLPFAVLLVELVDIERQRRQGPPEELTRLAERMEQALAGALGADAPGAWPGSLTRERPGRCWLTVPQTDRAGADHLAERLARALSSAVSDRGATLEVAIGTAVCPEDGREAAALAAHADVGLYAARSAVRASAGRSTFVDGSA